MKINSLFFLLIFLSACSSTTSIPRLNHTLALVNELKRDIQIPKIRYIPIPKRTAGYYDRITDTIYINSNIWPDLDPITQEVILLHEIGHGALSRPHLNIEKFDDGCPESLMLYNIEKTCYLVHKAYYLKELFKDVPQFYRHREYPGYR